MTGAAPGGGNGAAGAAPVRVTFQQGAGRAAAIMMPAEGRDASDFNELGEALADSGRMALAVQSPGIDGATAGGGNDAPALEDYVAAARDAALACRAGGAERVAGIGHRSGALAVLAAAQAEPNLFSCLVLLAPPAEAAGPEAALEPVWQGEEALARAEAAGDGTKTAGSEAELARTVRALWFAPGSALPEWWEGGWHAGAGRAQARASASALRETGLAARIAGAAAGCPVHVLAGAEDALSPPDLHTETGASLATLDGAGAALLPEQPDAVAREVLAFLDAHLPA